MKNHTAFLIALMALYGLAVPAPSFAATEPLAAQNYKRALASIEAGRPDAAQSIISGTRDTVLNAVIDGYAMALPGNTYSFSEINEFLGAHPDWPGRKAIQMIAEQKIPSSFSADQIVNWFNAHPPVTLVGFYRNIDGLEALGQANKAASLIRARWVERDFSPNELEAFYSRFSRILTLKDHYARLDDLLWNNDATSARRMYPFVDNNVKALSEARIALAAQLSSAPSLVARVPAEWQGDQGLLYEKVRWYRKNENDRAAIDILLNLPASQVEPEKWWTERHIMIRRVMDQGHYDLAYRLSANNGLIAGSEFVQAEFMAGWLALRFMNRADLAVQHFENLLDSATTPISRARGSYWLGRAYEALGKKREAEQSYQNAAALNSTFYGQLAAARIYSAPIIDATKEPPIPANVKANFFARDVIQAAEKLYRLGQIDRARSFFKAATDYADQRVEFVLIMDLAYKLGRPDWAINAAKAANQKNIVVPSSAFPVLSMRLPSEPDPAFTHAVIRQESLFHAGAGSPVGARGLMQLMPKTAQSVAKQLGLKHKAKNLTDPTYNVKLGTTYLQQQINQYNGSLILALAAYNAGPGRVKEWISQYGDPRDPRIDPVDWIEHMPIYETRNYVQRIMENYQVYRARLNGGRVPLTLFQDLKR